MYSAFVDPEHITPLGSTLPAIFAKTSLVVTSVFYINSNKKVKSRIFDMFTSKIDPTDCTSRGKLNHEFKKLQKMNF